VKNAMVDFQPIVTNMEEQKHTIILSGLVKELKEPEAGLLR
jgi:hypothetical protein